MTITPDRATRLRAMIEKHLGTRLKHDYGENPYVEVRVWEIAFIANQFAAAIDAEVREQCAQRVVELEDRLMKTAGALDRICEVSERGASWESAAHLRNRVTSDIRRLARGITRDIRAGRQEG